MTFLNLIFAALFTNLSLRTEVNNNFSQSRTFYFQIFNYILQMILQVTLIFYYPIDNCTCIMNLNCDHEIEPIGFLAIISMDNTFPILKHV